jgi:hypothetical protein
MDADRIYIIIVISNNLYNKITIPMFYKTRRYLRQGSLHSIVAFIRLVVYILVLTSLLPRINEIVVTEASVELPWTPD